MEELEIYEELLRLKRAGRPAALATVVESSGSSPRKAGAKLLLRDDGSLLGSVGGGRLEEETLRVAREALADGRPRTLPFSLDRDNGMVCGGRVLVYIEPLGVSPRLVVVGCGHIGQALARAARPAGFVVSLVDPGCGPGEFRVDGFASPDLTCPPEEIFERLPADGNTLVLIATPGHVLDFAVARAALATEAGYIGMVGSRRKRGDLGVFLAEAGLPDSAGERIVMPAGLAIGAQTPEEIAVSILAQLICQRRQHAADRRGAGAGCGSVAAHGPAQAAAPLR